MARRRGRVRHHEALERTRRRHLGNRQPPLDPQPINRRGRVRAIAATHPAAAQGAHWLTLADHITADTSKHALHPVPRAGLLAEGRDMRGTDAAEAPAWSRIRVLSFAEFGGAEAVEGLEGAREVRRVLESDP